MSDHDHDHDHCYRYHRPPFQVPHLGQVAAGGAVAAGERTRRLIVGLGPALDRDGL